MKLAMAQEMRNIDKQAMENYGISEIVLMENASREVARAANQLIGGAADKSICILAGSGNNGGDAFGAARHLANSGGRVKVFFLGNPEHMSSSAAANRNIIENMGISITELSNERDWTKLNLFLKLSDIVVDGLLGTGFKGTLRPELERLIKLVNGSGIPVLAIDIPSGVEADTGSVAAVAIKAAATMTLGLPKWGSIFEPGRAHTGELHVDGIGIPMALLEDEAIKQELIDQQKAAECMLSRENSAHKGSCGRILIIAGSKGMTGAAALCSRAVLRAGAGIATLAIPASLNDIMEVKLTEVMTMPVKDKDNPGHFGMESLEELLELSEKYSFVLIGPGLGREESTKAMVRDFVKRVDRPLLIDADAIFALKERGELLKECAHTPILTPHLGEMATLLGVDIDDLKANLLDYSRMAAADYNAIIVVKSERTMVVYPDGMVYVTTVGNPGMATAGCGDVLAGTISGLHAQTKPAAAAIAGVFAHGAAGDRAYAEKGYGMIASDILEKLPEALKGLGR